MKSLLEEAVGEVQCFCSVSSIFSSFLSFLPSILPLFLQLFKWQINATLMSKVIKMYYESPALLNPTVCEKALNLPGLEEDWLKERGGKNGGNFIIVRRQQKNCCFVCVRVCVGVCVCVQESYISGTRLTCRGEDDETTHMQQVITFIRTLLVSVCI